MDIYLQSLYIVLVNVTSFTGIKKAHIKRTDDTERLTRAL